MTVRTPVPVPVFVDLTGRRGRRVALLGFVLSLLLVGFVGAVATSVLVRGPVPGGRLPDRAAAWSHPAVVRPAAVQPVAAHPVVVHRALARG